MTTPDTAACPTALQQAVLNALAGRMCGDKHATTSALEVIFDHGDRGIYSAMWAEAVRLLGLEDDTPGPWVFEFEGPEGETVDTAPRGPVFAARFMTAWANGDQDMTRDLFFALRPIEDAELCADALINLLDFAAATAKVEGPSRCLTTQNGLRLLLPRRAGGRSAATTSSTCCAAPTPVKTPT